MYTWQTTTRRSVTDFKSTFKKVLCQTKPNVKWNQYNEGLRKIYSVIFLASKWLYWALFTEADISAQKSKCTLSNSAEKFTKPIITQCNVHVIRKIIDQFVMFKIRPNILAKCQLWHTVDKLLPTTPIFIINLSYFNVQSVLKIYTKELFTEESGLKNLKLHCVVAHEFLWKAIFRRGSLVS